MGTTTTREQTLARITQSLADEEITPEEANTLILTTLEAAHVAHEETPAPASEPTPEQAAALAKIRQLRPDVSDMHKLPKRHQQLAWAAYTDDARIVDGKDARALSSAKVLASGTEADPSANPHKLTAAQAKRKVTIHGTEMSFGEFIGHVLACEIRVPKKAKNA